MQCDLLPRLGLPHAMHARYLHEVIDATVMLFTLGDFAQTRNGVQV